MEHLTLADGRTLEYLVEGPTSAMPLVVHHGTPQAAVRFAPLVEAAIGQGLRVVQHSRPGYGDSTAQPNRTVASVAPDVAALMDALNAPHFVTVGWSGGGPHALACAALLPGRCLAAATIAGVAPYTVDDLDFLDGMGAENIVEFGAAATGRPELESFLNEAALSFAQVQPAEIVASMGDLLSDVDRRVLTGGFADYLAASFRRALSAGIAGWRDDDLAFVADWAFSLHSIRVPVSIWQGDQDRMVPAAHGPWLAANIPGASLHAAPGEGHLSLIDNFTQVVTDLLPTP